MRFIALLLLILSLCTNGSASAEEETSNLFKDVLRDQKAIWSSPFVRDKKRYKWIVPIAATTAFLINRDDGWSKDYQPSETTLDWSRRVSFAGSASAVYGTAGAFYLLGKVGHNDELTNGNSRT